MNLLKLITPINLQEEEVKFNDSKSYQPVFKYDWNRDEIDNWTLKSNKYLELSNAVLNQDLDAIMKQGELLFQVPWNETMLGSARDALKFVYPNVKKPSLNDLVVSQQEAMKSMGIDYQVEVIDAHGFVARPNHKEKKLQISKHVDYYYFSMESSVRHDLVHLIRYLNGKHNQIQRSEKYLPTEEGLAALMQDMGGKEVNNSRFQHAAEYTVTEVCRNGSLREAIEYLKSIGFPQKLAWQRAVRHKYGFMDTSCRGDIMKPAMYFAHSQKINDLSKEDRLKLFVGKIAIDDLSLYPEYRGIWSREKLSQVFNEMI